MNPHTKRTQRNSAIDRSNTRKRLRKDVDKNRAVGKIMGEQFKLAREYFKDTQNPCTNRITKT